MNQPLDIRKVPIALGDRVTNVVTGTTGFVEKIRFELKHTFVRDMECPGKPYKDTWVPKTTVVVRSDANGTRVPFTKFEHLLVVGREDLPR